MDVAPRPIAPRLHLRRPRGALLLLAAVLIAALVVACGGSGGDDSGSTGDSGQGDDSPSKPASAPATTAAIWISGEQGNQRVAERADESGTANATVSRTTGSAPALRGPVTGAARAGVLWTGEASLRRLELDRQLAPQRSTAQVTLTGEKRELSAARPDGERLWVQLQAADGSYRLVAFDADLDERWSVERQDPLHALIAAGAPQPIDGTTRAADATPYADRTIAVWSLTSSHVAGYDDKGEIDRQWNVSDATVLAQPSSNRLWIGDTTGITVFDIKGKQQDRMKLATGVRRLLPDSGGGAWAVLDEGQLLHLAADGTVDQRLDPGNGLIAASAADPRSGALWFVAGKALYRAATDGKIEQKQAVEAGVGAVTGLTLIADTFDPRLTIDEPVPHAALATNAPTIEVRYRDAGTGVRPDSLALTLGGKTLEADCPAMDESPTTCNLPVRPDGEYKLGARIADGAGRPSSEATTTYTLDTRAPRITLDNGIAGAVTNDSAITVSGRVSEAATVHVDDGMASMAMDDTFTRSVTLESDGTKTIAILAEDEAGNTRERSITVTRDTVAPSPVSVQGVTTTESDNADTVVIEGDAGAVEGGAIVVITHPDTGKSVQVVANDDGGFRATVPGDKGDTYILTTRDQAGNNSEKRSVVAGLDVPPDPKAVAPELPVTGTPPMADRVEFLYQGSNPIQTGVAADTIKAKRVAVLRGSVHDRNGNPVPGVTITVLDHPEFGSTRTQADGGFDLAVNGGGQLTVQYHKDGYLDVQRTLQPQWNDWAHAGDVVLTPLSDQVSKIHLTQETLQVAMGPQQQDAAGQRQSMLVFPAGVTATITTADGEEQQLSQLDVRQTEYTVGANGPAAMPGKLPPASAYTYAIDLSVDQAREQGVEQNGQGVTFSQPVAFYVDNFLDFPTGEAVPVGYYNPDKGNWIPSDNGRIVEILQIENGQAVVDVTGDGNAATQGQQDELGITPAERTRLAESHDPGDSLWRFTTTHLSSWDCNWPYGPPPNAEGPQQHVDPPKQQTEEDSDEDNDCDGCDISAQQQSLGEQIPVAGTPFSLHYQSNRAKGAADNTVTVPLGDGDLPDSLRSIKLTIDIGGREIHKTFDPTKQTYTFRWNGRDAYGRLHHTPATAMIRLAYHYGCAYLSGSNGFGKFGGQARALGTRSRCQGFDFTQKSTVTLDSPATPAAAVGNWSLSIDHVLANHTLLRGDGERRALARRIIDTVAGNGNYCCGGDGGPAIDSPLAAPSGIAFGPDGSLYIAESGGSGSRISRVAPDGTISTVAGTGNRGYGGDGGPATQAKLAGPTSVAIGPDGTLYIADTVNNRIRRVSLAGIIDTVAGTGEAGFSGDGGPAIEAKLDSPASVAIGPDGSLYVADSYNRRIRRIAPDGVIDTVAGRQYCYNDDFGGDGGPATSACLDIYHRGDIFVDSRGAIYIADDGNHRIRRVSPDGVIETIAGSGSALSYNPNAFRGDGGPATSATMDSPAGVTVSADGSVYIADTGNERVRQVMPNGTIDTVAGTGYAGFGGHGDFSGDKGPATEARLNYPYAVAVGPGGDLYIADRSNLRIRRVSLGGISVTAGGRRAVASKDGARRYIFNDTGHILHTENTRTGSTLYTFARNADGRLMSVTDGDGNTTTIERDSAGRATALVAPDGQRTKLTLDGQGHLTAVTDPSGQQWSMAYTGDGLLTRYADRTGATHTFAYDASGRLTDDHGPKGSGWTLARSDRPNGYAVSMTSGAGRTSTFALQRPESRKRVYTNTAPDGTITKRTETDTGDTTIERPDGTKITRSEGPDPRFGLGAPVVKKMTITTPAGLTRTVKHARTADVSGASAVIKPDQLTRSFTVNGRTTPSVFDGASHTWTTTTPEGRQATTTVDGQGRPTRTQLGPFAATERTYDARGRLGTIARTANGTTRTTQFAYADHGADAGYLRSSTGPTGRTVTYARDANGRVLEQTRPDGRIIGFAYDAEGRLTEVDPPGQPVHVLTYDGNGSRTDYAPPRVDGNAAVTHYSFNADEQLTKVERPDGKTVQITYDSAGKRSQVTAPAGTWTYGYTTTTGQLANLSAPGGESLAFTRDGPLLTQTRWSGPVNGTVSRTYDNSFRLTQQTVGGQTIAFSYDADSLLTQAGDLSLTLADDHPGITATSLNGVTTARTYNGFGELATRTAKQSGSALYSADYARDAAGRITEAERTVAGDTTAWGYTYDDAGRLTQVTADGTPVHLYTYGPNGNRTSHTGPNGTTTAEFDARDRLSQYGDTSYRYNAAGDRTEKTGPQGKTTYAYDALGNLRGVQQPDGTTIDYVIDGRNRRVGKKVNGTLEKGWLYQDGLNPVAQTDDQGNVTERFVYATKPNVPAYMIKDGTTYRFITDARGSVRLVVNTATGAIAQRMAYSPFGQVTTDTNPGFQPFGFAGGLYDPDTGLVRFGARDYDAETGRWTTTDPIRFAGGTPNLYGYTLNDPINIVDPSGLIGAGRAGAPGGPAVDIGHATAADLPSFPPSVVNAAAGFGDTASFGATRAFRDAAGIDGGVDPCSSAYAAGKYGAYATAAVGGGAALARFGPAAARAGFSRLPGSVQAFYAGNSAKVVAGVQDAISLTTTGAPPATTAGAAAGVAKGFYDAATQ